MSLRSERPIAPRDLARVLYRHKKKMLAWTVLVLGVSYAAIATMSRTYMSEAKLFVRLGRESVTLDPTATTGQTVAVQETRENQINSARDMLTSRLLLERVVENVGADSILNGPPGDVPTSDSDRSLASDLKSALRKAAFSTPVSPEEVAVEKLAKSISVKVGRNSSVIEFSSTAKNARLAQQILQAFLDAYQELHLTANRTDGSLDFFGAQAAHLKEQLDAAVAELRDAKDRSGLVSLPAQQKALQDQLTGLESLSMAADAALASSEASIESLRRSLADIPHQLPTQQTAGFANAAADTMQQEYFKLQVKLRDLESRLGEDHPEVTDTRTQLRHAETILSATSADRTQSTVALHPSRQALDLELRREEALAASLQAKAGTLKEQLAVLHRRTRDLNENEVPIAALERQVAIAETSYRSYVDHLEQARIGAALEAGGISNLNVVQPPSLVEKPISPKPTLILAAGLFVAVCGSLALAFGSEYLNQSLRTPEELEAQLGLPVLVSIPRATRHEVFVNN
jgi:polysaccharide biosynthesis protein PslE